MACHIETVPMIFEMPSKHRVLLIGTDHAYQKNMPGWNKKCNAPMFKDDMVRIISEYGVDYLLEEMSVEALTDIRSRAKSWLEVVGEERGIRHCFMDPDQAERGRQGILKEDFAKREQYWLERVCECVFKTALCVIGADHIMGFQKLLMRDYVCEVLDLCYDPAKIGKND